jgi:hypothetical protein
LEARKAYQVKQKQLEPIVELLKEKNVDLAELARYLSTKKQ